MIKLKDFLQNINKKFVIIGLITVIILSIIIVFLFIGNKSEDKSSLGTFTPSDSVDNTEKNTETMYDKSDISDHINYSIYNYQKATSMNGFVDSKYIQEFYEADDEQTTVDGIHYSRQNIPGLNASILVPDGYKIVIDENSSGWVYFTSTIEKYKNLEFGIFIFPTGDKSKSSLLSYGKNYIINNFRILYDSPDKKMTSSDLELTDLSNLSFSRDVFDPKKIAYVYNGNSGKDYIQLKRADIISPVDQKFQLYYYLNIPNATFMEGGIGVDMPSKLSFRYGMIRDQAFILSCNGFEISNNYRESMADTMAKSIRNPIADKDKINYISKDLNGYYFEVPEYDFVSNGSESVMYATQSTSFNGFSIEVKDAVSNELMYYEYDGLRRLSNKQLLNGTFKDSEVISNQEYELKQNGYIINYYSVVNNIDITDSKMSERSNLINPFYINGYMVTLFDQKREKLIIVTAIGSEESVKETLHKFIYSIK